MSFVEFLMEYYYYILAVLIVLIVGVIGFLVDSKNKNKKKNDVNENSNLNGGQVISNVDPLQGVAINNGSNNGIANMQPIMGDSLAVNQAMPQIQNNGMSMTGVGEANSSIVDSQNTSMGVNNSVLGIEPIITNNVIQDGVNTVNGQLMGSSVQPSLNNGQGMGSPVTQPIDINNNLGGISDISVLQGMQPIMSNNNISNNTVSVGSSPIVAPGVLPDITNAAAKPIEISNNQPNVMNGVDNSISNLNSQSQFNDNIIQSPNNQVQVSSNNINNSIDAINGINPQTNIPNGIPVYPINGGLSQVNNQNFNVGNNMPGALSNGIGNNVQTESNTNTSNLMQQMNGQVYMADNSQPFDISSMFGNNQQ